MANAYQAPRNMQIQVRVLVLSGAIAMERAAFGRAASIPDAVRSQLETR